ncbi:MAG: cytochrome c maturation protein CcmE [Deltaproteobacteria bacterium]|nr:cytochrome c maturation protein CcmE [Deltaproteobacteria bacterium]
MPKKTKYLAGFALIIGVFTYLLFTSFTSSLQYYVTASELVAQAETYRDKTLKVAGKAAEISPWEGEGKKGYQFKVLEGGAAVPVIHAGFVPDTFKEGAEVVVTGRLKDNGTVESTEILAKCASKYEAKLKE